MCRMLIVSSMEVFCSCLDSVKQDGLCCAFSCSTLWIFSYHRVLAVPHHVCIGCFGKAKLHEFSLSQAVPSGTLWFTGPFHFIGSKRWTSGICDRVRNILTSFIFFSFTATVLSYCWYYNHHHHHHHHPCYHLYAGYLQSYTWNKPCF